MDVAAGAAGIPGTVRKKSVGLSGVGAAAGHGSRRLGALRLSLTDRNYRMAQWQRLRRAIARDGLFAVVRRALANRGA